MIEINKIDTGYHNTAHNEQVWAIIIFVREPLDCEHSKFKLWKKTYLGLHIINIIFIILISAILFPTLYRYNGSFKSQQLDIQKAYRMVIVHSYQWSIFTHYFNLSKAYLYFGLYMAVPILLSTVFSIRLCYKNEAKASTKIRIFTLILALCGFYPQYWAVRSV